MSNYYYSHQATPPSMGTGQKYQTGGGSAYPGGDHHMSVAVPSPAPHDLLRDKPRWSWCSTVWSMIALLVCGSVCGFCGLVCSIFSYVDHKSGDYDRSRYKRKCSWGCTITGILLSLLVVLAVVLIFTVFAGTFGATLNTWLQSLQQTAGTG